MNNADSHGIKDYINKYIKILKKKYNIIIKH